MRLRDHIFGKKSIGKKVMTEIPMPDATEATDSVQATSEESMTSDSNVSSTLNSSMQVTQPAAVSESADPSPSADPQSPAQIKELIVERLRTVFDPEIPVNIYEMGLIYDVDVDPDGATRIRMTLTTPMCPAAEELPPEVESKARSVDGVTSVQLDLVWEPPWTPDMMSEAARLDLGMM